MAVTLIPQSASFIIEVRKGTDKNGEAKFANKSFSGVRENADPSKVLATAVAIEKVLAAETRNCYLESKNSLINEG